MLMAKHKKSSHQNGVRTRPKGAESHQYNHRAIFLTSMVMVRSESMESSSTDLKNLRNERNFPIGGALPFKGFAKTLRIKWHRTWVKICSPLRALVPMAPWPNICCRQEPGNMTIADSHWLLWQGSHMWTTHRHIRGTQGPAGERGAVGGE